MIDWVQENATTSWIAFAVILALVELASLDLVLLMFALGALAAAVSTALGAPMWVAIIVFAAVSLGLLFVVRPSIVERLHGGPTLKTGHINLVGRSAIVVETVTRLGGRVNLAGELWSARSNDTNSYETGTELFVISIDGATAVVSPNKES